MAEKGRALATEFVLIRPDGSKFTGELRSQVMAGSKTTGKQVGSTFAGGMLAGVGAVFAGAKIVDFFRGAFNEASEAARVTRLTNAALKSTGEVAKVSAKDITTLADSLSDLSGVDDEVIQSGENVLLTFTKVRNEAGKGNDIFDQGAEAALNLSGALGTDLQASIILVGKALNDPISGLTALKKAGVQLTEQQKEQIKGFVEAGDIMSAQKVILAELTTQFGGAAAAAASPADKARVAWGNFQEEVGNRLLPTLNSILTFATDNKDWMLPLVGSVAAFAAVIGAVIVAQKAWTVAQNVLGIGIDATSRRASRAALAIGGLVIAGQALNALTSDSTDLEGLADSIRALGESGQRSGELTRLFGKDLTGFGSDVALASSKLAGFASTADGIIPGLRLLEETVTDVVGGDQSSFGTATEHIKQVDEALAQLARGGNVSAARAAVYQLMQAGKLTADEAEALFPKWNNANKEMQRGLSATAKAEIDASAAGKTLIDTWNDLNDTVLSADDSMLAAHVALDGIKDAFAEGTKSVEGNSREVLENRVALEREAAAAQKAAADALANGESHETAAALLMQFKDQAIKATGATGAEAEAVRVLAEKLFSIPANVTSNVKVIIRNITEYSSYRAGERATGSFAAEGGLIKFFAGGGMEKHVAQIVKPGTWRVWGEDETGGEAYIPLAPGKRARSMDVLAEVADTFGYRLAPNDVGAPVGAFRRDDDGDNVRDLLTETRRTNKLLAELLPTIGPAIATALTGAATVAFQFARSRP